MEEPLSVPAAALSEACLDGAAVVRFGVNLPASPDANSYASCRRTSTDLAVRLVPALILYHLGSVLELYIEKDVLRVCAQDC